MADHYPLPWHVYPHATSIVVDVNGVGVADTYGTAANSTFIVKAVNCHDPLLAALKALVLRAGTYDEWDGLVITSDDPALRNANAAIAKAEQA